MEEGAHGPHRAGATAVPTAKHALPTGPEGAVVRLALLNRLIGGSGPPVVSIMAPAGYGKTTLLAQWAERSSHAAYLRLDERDDDPAVLLSDILLALERIEPIAPESLWGIVVPRAPPGLTTFQRLVDAIWEMGTPGVLMLDEIDHVSSRSSIDALSWIAERMPPTIQLVVAGRDTSSLPLARLAAGGRLLRVAERDLALDVQQVRQVAASLGLEVGQEAALELVTLTEGWPIGVYLSLLQHRGRTTADHIPRSGTDPRLLESYMRSELLESLEERERPWLVRSSVLDVMSGPLCDAALETTGSLARLRALERANLLIHRLDGGRAYRYHPLFRAFLRDELEVRMPGEAAAVASRASAWCDQHGAVDEAVEYARSTGDRNVLARLIERHAWPVHWAGRSATIERWVRDFKGDDIRIRYPAVAVVAGFACALGGQRLEAEQWLTAAERSAESVSMPDGTPDKAPWVAVLRALLMPAGVAGMAADVRVAREGMSPDSPFMPTVRLEEAVERLLAGSPEEAATKASEAIELAESRGALPGLCLGLGLQALMTTWAGDARAAYQVTQAGVARALASGLEESILCGLLYAVGARTALVGGSMVEARAAMGLMNRLRPKLTAAIPWLSVVVRLEAIRACIALADAASARTLLREIDDILHVRPDLGVLVEQTSEVRRAVRSMDRPGAGHWTLTAAELRVLSYLPTHLTFPEIAERLYVSQHTVKTQAIAIYGKLGASSRREAIERAVELGLLDASVLRFPTAAAGPLAVQ